MLFKVYISKYYFPPTQWPKGRMDEMYRYWKVRAQNRTEAALKIWARHNKTLLSEMTPNSSRLSRQVSLNVNSPEAGIGGTAGRLTSIRVL